MLIYWVCVLLCGIDTTWSGILYIWDYVESSFGGLYRKLFVVDLGHS